MIGSLLPSIVAAVLRPPTLSRSRLLVAQQQGYTQGQPAGWTTSFDFDGTPYFCSDQTGECQWEPPQWAQQGQSAQVTWSVRGVAGVSGFTHPDGFTHLDRYRDLPYFVQSGEELVLSRWNMEVQKLHVSREQCTVSVLGDGTASLLSCGKPPTLWRSRTGVLPYLSANSRLLLGQIAPLYLAYTSAISRPCLGLSRPYLSGRDPVRRLVERAPQRLRPSEAETDRPLYSQPVCSHEYTLRSCSHTPVVGASTPQARGTTSRTATW